MSERKECAGEKEDGEDEEVHDELKSLHVLDDGSECGAECREDNRDHEDEDERGGNGEPVLWAKSGDEADDEDECALNDGDGCAAERASEHDLNARHRSDERLFQEAELAVPQHGDAGEDGAEEDGHPDDAGGHELQVASFTGLLKDGAEAEAQADEVEHGLAEGNDDLHAGANVALQFAQPENVNRTHSFIVSTSAQPGAWRLPRWHFRRESTCR